jgi:hypothetical protein
VDSHFGRGDNKAKSSLHFGNETPSNWNGLLQNILVLLLLQSSKAANIITCIPFDIMAVIRLRQILLKPGLFVRAEECNKRLLSHWLFTNTDELLHCFMVPIVFFY